MSALDLLLVAAVLVGISVQAAIGFGFAFFAAPAAFAAFPPEQAVTVVLLLAIAIGCLVLFGERRTPEIARRPVWILVWAALPGMVVGAWLVTRADRELLQLLVGVMVLAGALLQAFGARRAPRAAAPSRGGTGLEVGGGLLAGVLGTSVTVNGPVVVLVLSRLGLRGGRLRDSLAAALLGLSLLATPVVLIASGRRSRASGRMGRPRLRPGAARRPPLRRRRLPAPRRRLPPPRGARRRGARRPAQHRGGADLDRAEA